MASTTPPAPSARHRVAVSAFALAAASLLLPLGCATRPPARPIGVVLTEAQINLARPEADPGCRATVQAPLASLGLAHVTVKLEFGPDRGVRLVEVLQPELTPAGKQALALAFDQCPWRPTVDEAGHAQTWTETYLRAVK